MRPGGVLFAGLVGTAIWALLLMAARPHVTDSGSDAATPPQIAPPVAPSPAQPVYESGPARAVSPDMFASPLATGTAPLERIAPMSEKKEPSTEAAPFVTFARPQSLAAGLIGIGARRLQLEGVIPTDPKRLCPRRQGGEWPCGMVALTQQRLFLRSRSIRCDMADGEWQGTRTATCRIGTTSVAEWLVGNGWAEAADGSPLAALAQEAKAGGRGLFGDDPR